MPTLNDRHMRMTASSSKVLAENDFTKGSFRRSRRCLHVLAFEAVRKQQVSGMEFVADGVCHALCIQFDRSVFALWSLFDSEGQQHLYCVCKQLCS